RARSNLSGEEFEIRRSRAPKRVGEVGEIRDSPQSFSVEVLLGEDPRGFRSAVFSVPKVTWDAWWASHGETLDPFAVRSLGVRLTALPRPKSGLAEEWAAPDVAGGIGVPAAGAPSCLPDDTWTPFLPGGRSSHSAVWTGSVMVVWGGENNNG